MVNFSFRYYNYLLSDSQMLDYNLFLILDVIYTIIQIAGDKIFILLQTIKLGDILISFPQYLFVISSTSKLVSIIPP